MNVNINDLEWTWTSKIGGFREFFAISSCAHILTVNCAVMAGDRKTTCVWNFQQISTNFSSLSHDPLRSTNPALEGVKEGYFSKSVFFAIGLSSATKNLSKAHVTCDSSGSANWTIVYSMQQKIMHFEGVAKFEASVYWRLLKFKRPKFGLLKVDVLC